MQDKEVKINMPFIWTRAKNGDRCIYCRFHHHEIPRCILFDKLLSYDKKNDILKRTPECRKMFGLKEPRKMGTVIKSEIGWEY